MLPCLFVKSARILLCSSGSQVVAVEVLSTDGNSTVVLGIYACETNLLSSGLSDRLKKGLNAISHKEAAPACPFIF